MVKPSLYELINRLRDPTVSDMALVSKAYHFAKNAHKDHKRFSGEPYFNHLFATAMYLTDLHMGPLTVAAGLLHDSIEDVGVEAETIRSEFGDEMLFLVEGVTNLGKVRYQGADRHIGSLRKFFVAMSKDLRVLIIKLCDRLHNMETLQYVRKEKQYRIAKETMEIYAPLAHRLGIRKLSRRLTDLAFPYVYPEDYKKTKVLMRKHMNKEDMAHLERMLKSIKRELADNDITDFSTNYRIKSLFNLYLKLKRKEWDIKVVYDIAALRIIVNSIEDCYRALGIIHGKWRPLPGRIKDYIAFPKTNGYRGIHTTVFTGDGSIVEIQIRTSDMHKDSEYGVTSHFEYKENIDVDSPVRGNNLKWLKQFLPFVESSGNEKGNWQNETPGWIEELAEFESHSDQPSLFLEHLRTDFFGNRVFVFTPKGDVVDLPHGANPIDFAYAIHSDIGNHLSSAIVNGKPATFDKNLKNGDIVEIITKTNSHPTQKWLKLSKTTLARRHIKNSLKQEEIKDNLYTPKKKSKRI